MTRDYTRVRFDTAIDPCRCGHTRRSKLLPRNQPGKQVRARLLDIALRGGRFL
jgi:hypothetical protein